MGGLISTTLLLLTLPPVSYGSLAYIALVPVFIFTLEKSVARVMVEAGGLGMIIALYSYWGAFFENPTLYVICVVVVTFVFIIVGALSALVVHQTNIKYAWIAIALVWSLPELLLPLFGLPFSYGVLLTENIPLLQYASYIGVVGVVIILFSLQSVLAVYLKRYYRQFDLWGVLGSLLLYVLTITIWSVGGQWVERNTLSRVHDIDHVISVQTALEPEVLDLTGLPGHLERIADEVNNSIKEISKLSSDYLVLWPESILPGIPIQIENDVVKSIYRLHRRQIIHAYSIDEAGKTGSHGWLLSHEGTPTERYDKTDPVPWVEEYRKPDGMQPPFVSDNRKIGVMICNDSSYNKNYYSLREAGADYIAVLTNDAYAGPSILPYLHMALERLHAIESGMGIVRAGNGGPSAIISPTGRVQTSKGLFQKGLVIGSIKKTNHMTFYDRYGYLMTIGYWVSLLCAVLMCIKYFRYKAKSTVKITQHFIVFIVVYASIGVVVVYLQYQTIRDLYKQSVVHTTNPPIIESRISVRRFIERDLGFLGQYVTDGVIGKLSILDSLEQRGLIDIGNNQPLSGKYKHLYGLVETMHGPIVLIQDKKGQILFYSENTGRLHTTTFSTLKTIVTGPVTWVGTTVKKVDTLLQKIL